MNIIKISRTYNYKRKVESIGGKAALFKVRRYPNNGGNYLLSYVNDVKKMEELPFELWIRIYEKSIENIRFFIEQSNLAYSIPKYNIDFMEHSVHIHDERFDEKEYEFWENMTFHEYLESNNLYVISKSAPEDLIGYKLNDDHYILFDKDENFCGVVFLNLTEKELGELEKDYDNSMFN